MKNNRKYNFEISSDAGRVVNVCAESKSEAKNIYLEQEGMPEWFFKKHCIIRNKGLV